MRRLYAVSAFVLILLLALSGSVFAQSDFVFCGDLPEEDCTLLQESQETMAALTSGVSQFDLLFSISNVPDMPVDTLTFNVNGDMAYEVDPALVEQMKSLQTDPSLMTGDPQAMTGVLVDLISGTSADLSLTVTLPSQLVEMMSSEEQAIPETISVDLRLVDGFAYVNLDDLATTMPDAGLPPGWMGVNLSAVMESAMQMQEQSLDGMGGMGGMDPEMFESYAETFQDPSFLDEFMSVERLEDTEVNGQPAAVFLYTFDYGAFIQSEAFQSMMQAQMEAMGEMMDEDIDEADQAEIQEAMDMMETMFEDLNLTVREVIGLNDKYSYTTEVHMDWDMAEFMASVEPDSEGPAPNMIFNITINNTGFDSAPEITAPEDANIFPLEEMMAPPVPSNDM